MNDSLDIRKLSAVEQMMDDTTARSHRMGFPGMLLLGVCVLVLSCVHHKPTLGFKPIMQKTRTHFVTVSHPEFIEGVEIELTEVSGDNGEPSRYCAVVDSVTCGDGQCRVIPVRLWWNSIGQFIDYELRPGENLTKRGHRPFSSFAHAKLKSILQNPRSALKNMKAAGLTSPSKWVKKGDGLSGATPATIKKIVVPGAAYTCFTLWHWANGGTVKVIREQTGMNCRKETLLKHLASRDETNVAFALEYLKKRKIHDKPTIDAVLSAMQASGRDLLAPGLAYLKQSVHNRDDYCLLIAELFAGADTDTRIAILEAMVEWPKAPTAACFERLCETLGALDGYFEVHLLFRLMEKHKYSSAKSIDAAVQLLKHDNFFIGRRALRYLDKQQLPQPARAAAEAFRKKNRGRL